MKLNLGSAEAQDKTWPPQTTIVDDIKKITTKINHIIETNILKGFDVEVDGITYHFSFKSDDQNNFQMKLLEVMNLKEQVAKGDSTVDLDAPGTVIWRGHDVNGIAHNLTFSYNGFNTFALKIGKLKETILGTGWVMKDTISKATNKVELKAISDELGLDTKFLEAREIATGLGLDTSDWG